MAKGQKRSSREPRKPKQATPKAATASPRSFFDGATAKGTTSPLNRKGSP